VLFWLGGFVDQPSGRPAALAFDPESVQGHVVWCLQSLLWMRPFPSEERQVRPVWEIN